MYIYSMYVYMYCICKYINIYMRVWAARSYRRA